MALTNEQSFAAANNAWCAPPPAHEIRDASLRAKSDETLAHLRHAHDLVSDLEDSLFGPVPRQQSGGSNPVENARPALRQTVFDSSETSANLVGRLSSLLERL